MSALTPPFVPPKVKLPREQDDWESVSDGLRGYTQRLIVPGGWIYRTVVYGNVACCFVPAPFASAPIFPVEKEKQP